MLCLKSEVLDDYDANHNPRYSGGGGGFLLPINFGSSIHKCLWRTTRKMTAPSSSTIATGNASSSSVSDLEDNTTGDTKSGDGNGNLYKYQLEQDVRKLQQQLQQEIDLRLALASAVEQSNSSVSASPCQLPNKARNLLDSITLLETTIVKLEQEFVTLQYLLTQERNERRLAQYHLRQPESPVSSFSGSPQLFITEQITRPFNGEEYARKMEDKSSCLHIIEKPPKDHFAEKLWNHPNLLSEEMIICMRDIFLFLADSSKLSFPRCTASPSSPQCHLSYSSFTSYSESPTNSSSIKAVLDVISVTHSMSGPNRVLGKMDCTENIGIYSTAVEVSWLSVGKKELDYASGALKRYRFLVEQLFEVNPSRLSCSEKMAFWINVYHALIMHAYLAYGIPRSDMKLFSLMLKASYVIGGHSFSAIDIEYSILKMKPPAHRPQMALILAIQKSKITGEQKKFSIDQPEPLLSFALSCGMHSSPAVRTYRPENVNGLLKNSLRDYVQASVGVSNKGKLFVPKLVYCFAKGIVDDLQLPEWICEFLSPEQAAMVRDASTKHKRRRRLLDTRSFSILPFDSRFRFLFLL